MIYLLPRRYNEMVNSATYSQSRSHHIRRTRYNCHSAVQYFVSLMKGALKLTTRDAQHRFEDKAEGDEKSLEARWQPVWLQLWVLLAMASLCAFLIAALVALFFFSRNSNGFTLLIENHFAWTLTPTAVLIIFVALWRQIDFYCKSLAPWKVLSDGPERANETVLLDYVSPLQVVSLWQSLRNRHFYVVLGVGGFLSLKLVALASTGLLIPSPTTLHSARVSLVKTAAFTGALSNFSIAPTLNDSLPFYTAFGIAKHGLPAVDGIHDAYVFEPFELPKNVSHSNTTITAEVDAIVPEFFCQSAPVNIKLQPANDTDKNPADTFEFGFPQCTMPDNSTGTPAYALNPQLNRCPPRQLSPVVQRISCLDDGENWELITLTDFRYNQTLINKDNSAGIGQSISASTWDTTIHQITSIACRSSYTMMRVNVTYDLSADPPQISVNRLASDTNTTLPGLTSSDLGKLFTGSIQAASDMFGNVLDNSFAAEYPNTLVKFMAVMNNGSYEALLDETTMRDSAQQVFQAVAPQILRKYYMQNTSEPILGRSTLIVDRLHVNTISLVIMVSGFIVALAVSIGLAFFRPVGVVPRDPEPLISMPLILSQHKDSQRVFKVDESRDLYEVLRRHSFTTREEPATHHTATNFAIIASGTSVTQVDADSGSSPQQDWWKPLFIRRWIYVSCLIITLLPIAVLEVLQHFSNSNVGIASVHHPDSLPVKITTRYLPAAIILLVATLINSIDFNIAVLAPYQASRKGWTPSQTLFDSVMGKTPPQALAVLLSHCNWGPLLSAIAALLASILSVIVAGLYTIDSVPVTRNTTMHVVDAFNAHWKDSVLRDGGAMVITSLAESSNLSYPLFTHEELALPTLQLAEATAGLSTANGTLLLQVPAWRAALNCTVVPSSQYNLSIFREPELGSSVTVKVSVPLPPNCNFGGSGGNLSLLSFSQSTQMPASQNTSYIGNLLDLHVGPFNAIQQSSQGELDPNNQRDNPVGCPSLAFVYGYVDIAANTANITSQVCYQQLDSIPTNATLNYPDLSVATTTPPIPIESLSQPIPANTANVTAFSFRPEIHFTRQLALFNQDAFASNNEGSTPIDPFFQAVLFGKHPIPIYHLSSTDPTHQTLVMTAIQGVYRRYMAQAISLNMRSQATTNKTLAATLHIPHSHLVVHQSRTSKLILQIMLATTFVLMSAAIRLTYMKETLRYNPCTIAGQAAPWAGSDFVRNERGEINEDMMGMDNGDLGQRLMRWEFRMGWWEREGAKGRRWGLEGRCLVEDGKRAKGKKEAKRFRDLKRENLKGGVSISWPLERGWYDVTSIVGSRRTSASNYDSRRTSVTEFEEETPIVSPLEGTRR